MSEPYRDTRIKQDKAAEFLANWEATGYRPMRWEED